MAAVLCNILEDEYAQCIGWIPLALPPDLTRLGEQFVDALLAAAAGSDFLAHCLSDSGVADVLASIATE